MNTLQNQMDKSGQRFVILYLWKKNLGVKRIRADMKQALGPDAYSKVQIAQCMQRFEQGDFSCKDESRPGRPLLSLGTRSLSIPLEVSIHKCTKYCSLLRSCSRFGETNSCNSIRPYTIFKAMSYISAEEAQKKSILEFSRDVFQTLEDHQQL